MIRFLATAAAALLLLGGLDGGRAHAQNERVTRIIVAFPAGGPVDFVALPETVAALNRALRAVLSTPAVSERLAASGAVPI